MKRYLLSLFSILILKVSFGQVTQGNWLIGGTASFSSTSGKIISSQGEQNASYLNYSISPNIGYFLRDKLAAGVIVGVTHGKENYGDVRRNGDFVAYGGYMGTTWLDFGPFVRYYLLPAGKQVNVLSEVNYKYGTGMTNPGKARRYTYSVDAGPVIYLNRTVGLEFTVGYNYYKSTAFGLNSSADDYTVKNSTIRVGVGLQVHLDKSRK